MDVMWNLDIWEIKKLMLIEIVCDKRNMDVFLSSYILENHSKTFSS